MRSSWFIQRSATAIALVFVTMAPARAEVPPEAQRCRAGVARASSKLLERRLKTIQNCHDRALQVAGACLPPAPADVLTALDDGLRAGVAKMCAALPDRLLGPGYLNFPGPCVDNTLSDGFTLSDLQSCLLASHNEVVDQLIDIEYNTGNVLDHSTLGCQKSLAKNAGKFAVTKLKALQKCRNLADQNKLDVLADACATEHAPTASKIATAQTNARASIVTRCTTTELEAIGICANGTCGTFCAGNCDVSCVIECLLTTHGDAVENALQSVTDVIDFEYPPPVPAP